MLNFCNHLLLLFPVARIYFYFPNFLHLNIRSDHSTIKQEQRNFCSPKLIQLVSHHSGGSLLPVVVRAESLKSLSSHPTFGVKRTVRLQWRNQRQIFCGRSKSFLDDFSLEINFRKCLVPSKGKDFFGDQPFKRDCFFIFDPKYHHG